MLTRAKKSVMREHKVNHRESLAEFRHILRRFLHFSEKAAARAGLTTQQHQLMLQIAGAPRAALPTVGYLAERLALRHHSVVELIDRCEHTGLVARKSDPGDARLVVLRLTPVGNRILQALSKDHARELNELAPALIRSLNAITAPSKNPPRKN